MFWKITLKNYSINPKPCMKFIAFVLVLFTLMKGEAQSFSNPNITLATNHNSSLDHDYKSPVTNSNEITKDTIQSFTKSCISSLQIRPLIIPAAFMAYSITALNNNSLRQLDHSTQHTIITNHPNFKSTIDNYSQYFPALAVYGLNVVGVKGKNNFKDRTIMYILTTLLSGAGVVAIKHIALVTRPDGSAPNSFPSGHTTTAFAAAEFLNQEYKDKSILYSVGGYAIATTTGILRMYNNRHYLSDIICGAGLGMLSTKLVYMVYPAIKKKFSKHTATINVL